MSTISALLAHLSVRRPVGSALDVGTGSAIQALLAAGHAEHVVADRPEPPRAAARAVDAGAERRREVELREGNLFEPVAAEMFDLVVSNPPFIVSPDRTLLFRDAEPDLCRSVVEGAASRLREGGSRICSGSGR